MYDVLEDLVMFVWEYAFLWVLLLMLLYFKKKNTNSLFYKYVHQQTPLFIALFLVILFGFFTNQDNDQQIGCIQFIEPVYALKNIVYFSISLALVIVALLFKDKDIRVRVLYLELLYWLIKLFITNKAHLVGIGGYTVANVTPFDYLSLVVRLQLINVVLEKKAKLAKVLIVAAIVILCKIAFDIVPSMF